MDLTVARELDAPTVIADEVAGETLVINLNTGAYFVIPPTSLEVWSALSAGVPASALLAGPDDDRTAELQRYVVQLDEAGLLRPAATTAPAPSLNWVAEDLGIEKHTDMADLLGLDPIHDADENIGWPMRPAE